MIAAGLCLMGGCFAQNDEGGSVDAYWPARNVAIPSSPASIAILQYDEVEAGVEVEGVFARIRQYVKEGDASFFYVLQFDKIAYNCYSSSSPYSIGLESNGSGGEQILKSVQPPFNVELFIDVDGAHLADFNMSVPACVWDSSKSGERLRIIDARAGEKDFYYSYGKWGRKWFVIPLRSALNTEAVFDFEGKVLVEL